MKLDRYNPAWPARFEEEKGSLQAALGSRAIRIEHVGSTAVPGLQAKPVIDIQVSVQVIEMEFFTPLLEGLGYRHLPLTTCLWGIPARGDLSFFPQAREMADDASRVPV